MEEQIKLLNDRLTRIENNLGGLSNDPRQTEVIRNALKLSGISAKDLDVSGDASFGAQSKIGFFGEDPATQENKINDPSGGATQDAEARTAIGEIIDSLEAYGLTASS